MKQWQYILATALDPHFKLQFLCLSDRGQGKRWLLEEVMKYKEQILREEREDESVTDSDTSGKQSGWDEEDAFMQWFKEIGGGTGNSTENVVKGKISEDKDVSVVDSVEEDDRYL